MQQNCYGVCSLNIAQRNEIRVTYWSCTYKVALQQRYVCARGEYNSENFLQIFFSGICSFLHNLGNIQWCR